MPRPKGAPKTGGLKYGQTWSRETIADRIWRVVPTDGGETCAEIARRAHANYNTVKHALRAWLQRRGVTRSALDGRYRRLKSCPDRPSCQVMQ